MKFVNYSFLCLFLLSSSPLTQASPNGENRDECSSPRSPSRVSPGKAEEDDNDAAAAAIQPSASTPVSDGLSSDWESRFYVKGKYSVSDPVLDLNKVTRAILAKELDDSQYQQIMHEVAASEDPNLQEKIYSLITTPAFKCVNEKAAAQLLEKGLEQERTWAFWAKAQHDATEGVVTKWHGLAANRGHGDAKAYVAKYSTYQPQQADDFVTSVQKEKNSRKRRLLISSFEDQWSQLGDARPFLDVVGELSKRRGTTFITKEGFIKKAADLGDLASIIKMVATATALDTAFFYAEKAVALGEFSVLDIISLKEATSPILDSEQRRTLFSCYKKALERLERGAPHSAYNMGALLLRGFKDQSPSKKQAFDFFIVAADEGGHINAMCILGTLLKEGFEGQDPDPKKALSFYKMAAWQGDPEAMVNIGELLEKGFAGQRPDPKKALVFYEGAAALNNNEGMNQAGCLLETGGIGLETDFDRAFEYYRQAARKGHSVAAFNAGWLLQKGFGDHPPNPKAAFPYFIQAAEAGFDKAMFNVGCLLNDGFPGQAPDPKAALTYFKQAAKAGVFEAMNNVGCLFNEGFKGQPRNIKQASRYFKKAATKGVCLAQFNLALCLSEGGEGVEQDLERAKKYLSQAASQGLTLAMVELSKHYLGLFSTDHLDLENALFWLLRAHGLGDPHAKQYLELAQKIKEPGYSDTSQEDQALTELLEATEKPIFSQKTPANLKGLHEEEHDGDKDSGADSFLSSSPSSSPEDSAEEEDAAVETIPSRGKEEADPVPERGGRNPKYMRDQLRKACRLQREREARIPRLEVHALASKAQAVVDNILGGNVAKVSQETLKVLFQDPFFDGQVVIDKTKNGIMVSAHNRASEEFFTTSTHRLHTKNSKGALPLAFIKDLKIILNMFDLNPEREHPPKE